LRQAAIDRAFDLDELSIDANEGAGLDGCDHAAACSTSRASCTAVTDQLVARQARPVAGQPSEIRPDTGQRYVVLRTFSIGAHRLGDSRGSKASTPRLRLREYH
jgi:hypothetical protein